MILGALRSISVHISLFSLMPENLVFVIKMLTILVEMPKLPERGGYYANNTFTQIKISDRV